MIDKKTIEVALKLRDQLSGGLKTAASKASTATGRIARSAKKMGANFKAAALSVKGLVAAFLALAALRQVIVWMKETINLAAMQELAINKLESAMRAVGEFTAEGSKGLQDFARNMQKITTIGDEVTLAMIGTLRTLTKLDNEGLKKAAQASIGLAKVMKIDVNNAALIVGKSIGSSTNALIRYGVELDTNATQSEKVIQLLQGTSSMFEVAKGEVNTYAGAMIQLDNIWGDFRESVGAFITSSPGVIAVIKEIGKQIGIMAGKVDGAREDSRDLAGEGFTAIITGGIGVIRTFNAIAQVSILAAIGFNKAARGMLHIIPASAKATKRALKEVDDRIAGLEKTLQGLSTTEFELSDLIEDINRALEESKDAVVGVDAAFKTVADTLDDKVVPTINKGQEAFEEMLATMRQIAQVSPALFAPGTLKPFRDITGEGAVTATDRLKDFIFKRGKFGLPTGLGSGFGPFTSKAGQTAGQIGEDFLKSPAGLASLLGSGFSGAQSGGTLGAISALLPTIGSAFGPIGSAVGGLLGGAVSLFGKKRRGETPAEPVYTSDVNLQNTMSELLNAVKSQLVVQSAGGLQRISDQLRSQALAAAYS